MDKKLPLKTKVIVIFGGMFGDTYNDSIKTIKD